MANHPNILILGASSLIAPWLVKRLTQNGFGGQCYSRTNIGYNPGNSFTWQEFDTNKTDRFRPQPQSIIISLLPLSLLPSLLPQIQDCRHLIAFSTTSIFSKQDSPASSERKLIQKIMSAEEQVIEFCNKNQTPWTLLRPTLIYDGQSDKNVTAIANFIKRWHILPIIHPADGLRQPVHADDLAIAVTTAVNNPNSFKHAFNLGGGEILSYREMVLRIFEATKQSPRIISLPSGLFKLICRYSKEGSAPQNRSAMFMRMNQDLVFDWSEARDTLSYSPRSFQPQFR